MHAEYAKMGMLDLTQIDFNHKEFIKLRGDWNFYWNQLLFPEQIGTNKISSDYFSVPGKWNSIHIDDHDLPGTGYCTLVLHFKAQPSDNMALLFKGAENAIRVFLNKKEIFNDGIVSDNKKTSKPSFCQGIVKGLQIEEENELIIQLSNYHFAKGGLEDIFLGKQETLEQSTNKQNSLNFILFGSIFFVALYHIGLYIIRKQFIASLYFGLFCTLIAIRTLAVGSRSILEFMHIDWAVMSKIEYLSFYISAPFFIFFVYELFHKTFSRKFLHTFVIISVLFTLLVIFTKPIVYTRSVQAFQFLSAIGGIYIIYVIVKSFKLNKKRAIIFLVGWIILFATIINDILYTNEILHISSNMSSAGLGIFILFQAYLLAIEFSEAVIKSERLAKKLNYTNKNLSKIVEFRTSELENQKKELFEQNLEIEGINKDITDSLDYASKIQTAVLPDIERFEENFNDFFIYYQPKDIVSGDFYWIKRVKSKIIVAAADCTGHGVPGAFMSLLGMAFLNEIVNFLAYRKDQYSTITPDLILNLLREKIKSALNQTGDINEAFDGIDMALCIIDYSENILSYSGANNSLYITTQKPKVFSPNPEYTKNNKVLITKEGDITFAEIKANRMPIGTYLSEKPFTTYEFVLDEIDNIYMFSDGYADQVGGPKKTKYRIKRFKELILKNSTFSMPEQYSNLKQEMEEWMCKDIGQIDDITVLGVKVHSDSDERSFGLF